VYYLCIVKITEIINIMDKHDLLKFWAGELIRVKAELLQVSWLLQQGVHLTRTQENELNRLLDQKIRLEKLIKEFEKKK